MGISKFQFVDFVKKSFNLTRFGIGKDGRCRLCRGMNFGLPMTRTLGLASILRHFHSKLAETSNKKVVQQKILNNFPIDKFLNYIMILILN